MAEAAGRRDPFPAFRFQLQIDGIAAGGFSECSGLETAMEVVEYREGGVNDHVHRFPGRAHQHNIILRRGIVDRALNEWYERTALGEVYLKAGSIEVYDAAASDVVMEWRFLGAFPCRWVGPELNGMESRVAVETLELCHQGITRTI